MPTGIYPRKVTVKSWVRKLDTLVKMIVLARDSACVTCGSRNNLEPGHLFTRAWYSTRWDLENVYTQCHNCNFNHERDPYPLTRYFLGKHGQKKYDELHKVAKTPHKGSWKIWELEELYKQLEKRLQ